MKTEYDVIIVGAGPAGIFSALELTEKTNLKVLMLDRGHDVNKRKCPASLGLKCKNCNPCSMLSGWGGAGAFSDGKLNLSSKVGGWLDEYVPSEKLKQLIKQVDSTYLKFGASIKRVFGRDKEKIAEIRRKAGLVGLKLIDFEIRHMGTEKCAETLKKMQEELGDKTEIRMRTDVERLIVKNRTVRGIKTIDGEEFLGKYVIVAPGRSGAEWLKKEAENLGLKRINNPVDIGVRVEVLASVMEELTDTLYEPKLVYCSKSFEDEVRTFCVAPYGEVVSESYNGVLTVNGQSYAERKTENTNFAILVSTSFTEPFKEPIAYGKYIARLSNLLSGGILVQRLSDLEKGRRSTPERISRGVVTPTLKNATPGDLSFVLPHRYLADIKEMLQVLDKIVPGIHSSDTLLYGVEVKFYSSRLELTSDLETKIHNLFTIGDGAGITRGLVQASVSGIIAGREIIKREKISI